MSLPLTRIEQLITEELDGIISLEDQALLDKAKAESPEVYKLWSEKRSLFAEKKVQDWMEKEMAPPAVPMVPVIKWHKQILIAASFLILVATVFCLLEPRKRKASLHATDTLLRLETGEVINLSQETTGKIGDISFSNYRDSLTYTTTSATKVWATLTVPEGRSQQVTLSDGTKIFMNAASSVHFPMTFNRSGKREITFTGEAYIVAAGDANRPFSVNLPEGTIQVLGTEFNVNSYDKHDIQVSLVSGKVQFKAGEDSALLAPGYAATLSNGNMQTELFDTAYVTSWRKGIFQFDDRALKEICKIIPRWFRQEIIFDNNKIALKRFSGIFEKKRSAQENLNTLKLYGGFEYYIKDDIIHIY